MRSELKSSNLRTIVWTVVTVGGVAVAGLAICRAQQPTSDNAKSKAAASPVDGAAADDRPVRWRVSTVELNDARILFGEMDEKVRIAAAKLDEAALQRKRKMGAIRSLMAVTDQQISLLSSKIQRWEERQRQLKQDLMGVAAGSTAQAKMNERTKELLIRSAQPVMAEKKRLEKLSRRRSQLQLQLDDLRREHIHRLLEAAIAPDSSASDPVDLVEQILAEELGGN